MGRSWIRFNRVSFCKSIILSSNAWPGPIELIKDQINGIVLRMIIFESFIKKFKKF